MTLEPLTAIRPPLPAEQAQPSGELQADYDLVIVGGGLAGLTLACALKDSGFRIALLEARPHSIAASKGQAYHISLMSSRIFQGIGVWDAMRPEINAIEQIRLSDQTYPGIVQFTLADLGVPALGYVAEHRVLLEELQRFLTTCSHVTYCCPAELVHADYQANGVELTVRQPQATVQVKTKLLVAADGARSPIRQNVGIPTDGWQYWQSCVVAFIQPEKSHQNTAYERFWSDGPFAILPLPNNICRIVWTAPKAKAAVIAALSDAEFLALLKQRYGDQMGELSLVGDRYVFPVQLMQSRHYVQPHLALIGDAAHCCHPVGGQGINLGIRDAAALAQVLQTAQTKGEDIGSLQVLQRYERWRRPENFVILGFTDFLDRCFSNNIGLIVVLRRLGLRVMQAVQPIKLLALRLMVGLLGQIPELAKR